MRTQSLYGLPYKQKHSVGCIYQFIYEFSTLIDLSRIATDKLRLPTASGINDMI